MDTRGKSACIVGCGQIGGYTVALLARTGAFERLIIIDPDVFEERNLGSQNISPGDVGRPKVDVVAAAVHRIAPWLQVEAIARPVEMVPLGRLRADVIGAGLDNLASRLFVSRAAWRLAATFVDAGVRPDDLLARVDVFEPGHGAACMECGLDHGQRARLYNRYPCVPDNAPTPTGGPAYLGALAASIQCAEMVKAATGDRAHTLAGRQVLVDLAHHRHYVSARRRAPDCAFDHGRWSIRCLGRTAGAVSIRQALDLAPASPGHPSRLRVAGEAFALRLTCPDCHASRPVLHLLGRLGPERRACPSCGADMVAAGIDTHDSLSLDVLTGRQRGASLHALGLRGGDVFSIETAPDTTYHFETGGR